MPPVVSDEVVAPRAGLEARAPQLGLGPLRGQQVAVTRRLASDVAVSTRTVDQHVVLRRRLGGIAAAPRIVETVYGHGYRLAAAPRGS